MKNFVLNGRSFAKAKLQAISLWLIAAIIAITAMAFTACSKKSETQTATAEQTQTTVARYKIGDIGPGGGIVFYDKGNDLEGWRYMEAAVNFDITSSHAWGYFFNDIGTQTAIGTGKENTRLMLTTGAAPAAQACVDFRGGGKNDWFLPSKDELNELYKQRNHFESTRLSFWSSSQGNEYNAWNQNFDNGKQEYNDNTNDFAYSVRAIRSFSADTAAQSTTQTTTPYAKILSGDFSDFAGRWVNDHGGGWVDLTKDGLLQDIGYSVSNIKKIGDAYSWDLSTGVVSMPVFLFPAGTEITDEDNRRVQTDTTKDRIAIDRRYSNQVYYRQGETQAALEYEELRAGSSVTGVVGRDWIERYNIRSVDTFYISLVIESEVEILLDVYNGQQFIKSSIDDSGEYHSRIEIAAQPNTVYILEVSSYVRDVTEAAFRISAHLSQ